MAKQELLESLDQAFRDFKESYAGLSEEQASQTALDQWAVKDVLAHVTGWHYEIGRMFDRMLRGERPTPEDVNYDDVNAWNARFVEQRKGRSLIEAQSDLDASFIEFRSRVESLPEDRLAEGKTAHRLVTVDTRDHYREHGDQIATWRRSAGS